MKENRKDTKNTKDAKESKTPGQARRSVATSKALGYARTSPALLFVTAPSSACATRRAYLAKTPLM